MAIKGGNIIRTEQIIFLVVAGCIMILVLGVIPYFAHQYNLDGIKSKTVGDGQYGTARFATEQEIRKTFFSVVFEPEEWRKGNDLPQEQGIIVGSTTSHG